MGIGNRSKIDERIGHWVEHSKRRELYPKVVEKMYVEFKKLKEDQRGWRTERKEKLKK